MNKPVELHAVIFDWGDTLVHVPGLITRFDEHLACLETFFQAMAGEPHHRFLWMNGIDWPTFRLAYTAVAKEQLAWSSRTQREHRFQDRFKKTLHRAGLPGSPSEQELLSMVDNFADHVLANCRPVRGVDKVVPELARKCRLGIVSNYPYAPVVQKSLERFALAEYFSSIVVSGEVGWIKPHPRIFQTALDQLQTSADRVWFVGDDLKGDMAGAKALGFYTAWLAPGDQPRQPDVDCQLNCLTDLLEVIG